MRITDRRNRMSAEEVKASWENLDKFSREVEAEKIEREKVEGWRRSHPWVVAGGAVGFLLFGCYAWIEFVKFCVWAGQYTWP